MLVEEFLKPMELTQRELAQGIYVAYQRVNELVNPLRGLKASIALRLAKYCGTSPDFWMHLQLRWDLYHTQRAEAHELKKIKRVTVARRVRWRTDDPRQATAQAPGACETGFAPVYTK